MKPPSIADEIIRTHARQLTSRLFPFRALSQPAGTDNRKSLDAQVSERLSQFSSSKGLVALTESMFDPHFQFADNVEEFRVAQ